MPIVRVDGSDAESFEVAEMTDNQYAQQRNWASPPPQSKGVSSPIAKIFSSMPEIDDSTSTISSSRRTLEDITRAVGIKGIGSILVCTNSNHGETTSSDKQPSRNSFSSMPLYEAVERNYDMQHDPRNPFETPHIGHPFIQEEDETISLSTMDDSFISPCIAQQSINHPIQQSWMQSQQKNQSRSYRNRPKYQSSIREPVEDNISVPSISSIQGSSKNDTNHQKSTQSIASLESLVAKLNFELASTKSSLDELKLENRNLQLEKISLSTNLMASRKENDRLRVHIVRLEKEKILRNIEGTKGVARPSMDRGVCLDWSEFSVSDNQKWSRKGDASVASSNRVYIPIVDYENGGGYVNDLSRQIHNTSSYESGNDLSVDGDGDSDCDVSINFNGINNSLDGSQKSNTDEMDKKIRKGGLNLLNIIGGGKKQSVRNIESSRAMKNATDEDSKISAERFVSNQRNTRINGAEDNGIRSNAQIDDDSNNIEDPFETWSAPGDLKRNEQEQNWLQRGFGGRRRDDKPFRQHHPQSNEIIEPINSCNGDNHSNGRTSSRGRESDMGSAMQDKSFGFFKGFGKGR
jgi:hypothetical protein